MNKKLDFIKLEKRVLNGGRRYIPRFYRDANTKHFFKMVYCGVEFFYDAYHNIGPELSLSCFMLHDAIAVFGYFVAKKIYDKTYTIPDVVEDAIKLLHKTDRLKKVKEAESIIFQWYKKNVLTSSNYQLRSIFTKEPYVRTFCTEMPPLEESPFEESPFVEDDTSELKEEKEARSDVADIGMGITLSADGARKGDYDLNKLFGITFDAPAPDREFLKSVSITKQHLSLVNKVIQSVYRIKEREKKGVSDLGQLIGADFININFIGEPGTGKSFGLKIVSAILGAPLYIETFSGDSDTDKFQGTNTISKGAPTFEWTAVPLAHKNGGFCALEEVNQMRPDKTMAMSQALVDPFLLKVDNTMDVYRNPYTFYVNLFNIGTEGSKPFNEAYINRFGYTYDFCEDSEEIENKQLHLMLGYTVDNNDEVGEIKFTPRRLTDADFDMAISLKNRVVNYLTGDTVARDEEAKAISKRQCKEFLVELQNGLDAKSASVGTFVNTLKCVDRELAEEVLHNVIDVFPFENYR